MELNDADQAGKMLRNLARWFEQITTCVGGSILEWIDDFLTAICISLPPEVPRSLVCTTIIENIVGSMRRISRNVKRWRNANMALRWTAADMMEPAEGFINPIAYQ
ncbi:hypothetical protein [Acidiphilium acidophilum]|uniref:hypothetical protein n=1 Tax=Acidiphilium acidophilum TaxID=76588 RepID=UPI002F25F2F0